VRLARALLAVTQPVVLDRAPAGGALPWNAPIGAIDVAPGTYLRADGRVRLDLSRPRAEAGPPLDDAALARLQGAPLNRGHHTDFRRRDQNPYGVPEFAATLLLVAAAVLWIVAALPPSRRLLLPQLATAIVFVLLI